MKQRQKTNRGGKTVAEEPRPRVIKLIGLGCFTFSKQVHLFYRRVRHIVHSAFFGATAWAEWLSHPVICYASLALMAFTLLGAVLKEPSA